MTSPSEKTATEREEFEKWDFKLNGVHAESDHCSNWLKREETLHANT